MGDLPDVVGLDDVSVRYRELLGKRNEADFDEQVVGAIDRLLADAGFRHRAQRYARLLLVDEFQDLTPAHMLLFRLLSGPAGEVFGVGDDDQTIYGYAGATPDWLVRFADFFPGSADHALEVNYRCPAQVVTAASNLLSRNALRVAKRIRPGPDAVQDASALSIVVGETAAGPPDRGRVMDLLNSADPSSVAVLSRVNASLAPVQVVLGHHGVATHGGVDQAFSDPGRGRCRPVVALGRNLSGWHPASRRPAACRPPSQTRHEALPPRPHRPAKVGGRDRATRSPGWNGRTAGATP